MVAGTAPTPSPRKPFPRRKVIFGAAVAGGAVAVVLILILAGILFPGSPLSPKVTVTGVTLSFLPASDPCFGLGYANDTPVTLAAGAQETLLISLTDQAPQQARGCTVGAVSISTPGFSLVSANVPLQVGDSGSATLKIEVKYPSTSYSGPLNLSAPVTYISPNITVQSQSFTWSPGSNACGLDSPVSPYSMFAGFAGDDFNDSAAYAAISGQYACTITAVTTSTPGFSVISASVPDAIPENSFSGVSFELRLPSTAYNGTLSVTFDLTW